MIPMKTEDINATKQFVTHFAKAISGNLNVA